MKDDFCYLLRVRYAECDAQNVVFNGKYVEYIDIAGTEFMRVIWGDYNNILAKGIDYQVVNLNIDWQAPAHFDEIIAMTVKATRIGSTSFTLKIEFSNFDKKRAIASAGITYVMVNSTQYTKTEIPHDMRKQLKEGAPGTIVNHSGISLST